MQTPTTAGSTSRSGKAQAVVQIQQQWQQPAQQQQQQQLQHQLQAGHLLGSWMDLELLLLLLGCGSSSLSSWPELGRMSC